MDYRKAGYTHVIKYETVYETVHDTYGVVSQSFPTTADAVEFWLNYIKTNRNAFNVQVVELTEA